jgi:hypothetical protein
MLLVSSESSMFPLYIINLKIRIQKTMSVEVRRFLAMVRYIVLNCSSGLLEVGFCICHEIKMGSKPRRAKPRGPTDRFSSFIIITW